MNLLSDINGKLNERRLQQRFQAREGAYVAINNNGSFIKIGQIQNISKGGFACRYVANGEQIEGLCKADIFVTNDDFYLKNIPFKAISDVFIDFEIPFSTTRLRQCGGQFGELTQSLISLLDYFIKNYTTAAAYDFPQL